MDELVTEAGREHMAVSEVSWQNNHATPFGMAFYRDGTVWVVVFFFILPCLSAGSIW